MENQGKAKKPRSHILIYNFPPDLLNFIKSYSLKNLLNYRNCLKTPAVL